MASEVVVTRDISAPASTVWAMVSDLTRMGEWSPENTGAKWIKGATGPVVGAKFQGSNETGGKKWKTVGRVTASDPGERFAFHIVVGPLAIADWTFSVTPTDAGCTVRQTFVDRRNKFAQFMGGAATGVKDRNTHNRAGMEATLDALKAAAESAS